MSHTTKNPRLYLLLAHNPSFPLSGRVFEFFFFLLPVAYFVWMGLQ